MSQRKQVLASVTAAAIGCFTSCAREAVSSPIVVTRLMCARSACAWRKAPSARLRDSSTRRFISINPVISKAAARKATNRKKVADSLAWGNSLRRKKRSKANAESATENRPGPSPPKRLLTVTARRKHDEGASMGRATTSATPQETVARP